MKTPPLQKEGMFFCWDGKTAAVACRRKESSCYFNITKDPRKSMALVYWAWCRVSWHSGMH